MTSSNRREFLSDTTCLASLASLVGSAGWLRPVGASEMRMPPGAVRFGEDMEPLVQWLESTPKERVVPGLVEKIQSGLPYHRLLAAIFLAGIRNVQPRPNVGFKFHTVLVVHAAHQASLAATHRDRWLPLLWSADYFKRAQEEDVRQGDWIMSEPANVDAMSPSTALQGLEKSLDDWDVEAADRYATAAARQCSTGQLFELFAKYGSRDFRDIGHKAIYVAGAFRLLDTIGHELMEPIARSLAFAILNHGTGPNPAGKDLDPDRPGKVNWERSSDRSSHWMTSPIDPSATGDLLQGLREWSDQEASQTIHDRMNRNLHWKSAYDALFVASSELVMRQNGIVPLHAVTSTNAIHYLFRSVQDERLRRWLLLQNTAFVCLLRNGAKDRDKLRDVKIDELNAKDVDRPATEEIFRNLGKDKDLASKQVLAYLQSNASPVELLAQARNFVFCKGSDSHDYKFSSAIIEDFVHVSPEWRHRYLAGCSQLLHGSSAADTALFRKVRELLPT